MPLAGRHYACGGAKTLSAMRSTRATGRYVSDQAAVWDGVAGVLAEHRVSALTGS